MMIAAPCYVCWRARGQPISLLDILATVSFVFFFLIEIIADEQQWVSAAYARERAMWGLVGLFKSEKNGQRLVCVQRWQPLRRLLRAAIVCAVDTG